MSSSTSADGRTYIEYWPVEDVFSRETEGNPKDHDIPKLLLAICRFGYNDPVVVDERTGRLIAGNGRTLSLHLLSLYREKGVGATKNLGVKIPKEIWGRADKLLVDQGATVPKNIVRDEDGRWLMPVTRGWSSRNDAEAKAAVIASNKLTEEGGWFEEKLAQWLTDIVGLGGDLVEFTGFDADDLADISAIIEAPDDLPPRVNSRTFAGENATSSTSAAPAADDDPDDPDDDSGSGSGGSPRVDTYEEFGEPDDAAFRPKITITVDNDLFDRWRTLLDRYPGNDDAAKLERLVTDAEQKL